MRVPVGLKARVADAGGAAFVVDAIRRALDEPPRWRPLLGEQLADRVAGVAEDPGAFCLAAVERAVVYREREPAGGSCPHPERDRRGNRCGRCGAGRLPAVVREHR